ncbi:DNA repair protein RecO [Flammeovirga kamogawensis]|uniref:DNA repair protein RecO n=1 Tax=Flammeovirga kamogawensis TaxID=373891 RepID=A0ABX8GT53_9BACT|nr:DNA repair protein RecO [Flammeovirga kamogawensis]MBB6463900.1 DNA repair protein RecO (recombination protein O) [Flammeovirga kamogawensis]QWG06576.1 DNA repair protein RecO [Flammeovirga kamogawensis]TRX68402.1 DNA repair protein RecO [Flammeovirga kamogawensis]
MIASTKGITLSSLRYRESSLIVHVYTEEFGRRDYIIKGAFSKKSNKASFYQPLNLLAMEVYENPTNNLNLVKEVQVIEPLLSFRIVPQKSMILTFVTEFLEKVLRDDEVGNKEIFEFLSYSLIELDKLKANWNCFTLQFMMRLSNYLGFGIENGEMLIQETDVAGYEDHSIIMALNQLLNTPYDSAPQFPLQFRRQLMDIIIKFYALQIPTFGELKTLQVLREMGTISQKRKR